MSMIDVADDAVGARRDAPILVANALLNVVAQRIGLRTLSDSRRTAHRHRQRRHQQAHSSPAPDAPDRTLTP